MNSHILIIDDDERLRHLLKRYLLQQQFLVSTAKSLDHAQRALDLFIFDGLIVDIMMPERRGTDILSWPNIPPVLLLSAMGEGQDRIQGLQMGAHDYLVKPFEPEELVLRLKNILRQSKSLFTMGVRTYCIKSKILFHKDIPLHLSFTEGKLLHYLVANAHQTLSRQQIAQEVFPESSNDRVVDVQISRLRRKLEDQPDYPQYLISVRGEGYYLKSDSMHS